MPRTATPAIETPAAMPSIAVEERPPPALPEDEPDDDEKVPPLVAVAELAVAEPVLAAT